MEDIFEIRSCTEILANDIISTEFVSICSIVNKELQVLYILGDIHLLRGMSGLHMYDLY